MSGNLTGDVLGFMSPDGNGIGRATTPATGSRLATPACRRRPGSCSPRDGEQLLHGHVTRVANGCVYFKAADDRLVRFGWLPGGDVAPA